MTQPRRSRPPDPEVADLKAQVAQLQDDLARLRSANTAQALERLGSRLTALEQKPAEQPPPEQAPPPPVDIVPLLEDIASVREQVARMAAGSLPSRADLERLGARITTLEQKPTPAPPAAPEPPKVDLSPLDNRLAAVEDKTARLEAGTGSNPALTLLAERVSAIEAAGREQTPPADERLSRETVQALLAAQHQATLATVMAEVAPLFGMVDAVARDVLTLKTENSERADGIAQAAYERLAAEAAQVADTFKGDRTLYSALFPSGMQVATAAIIDSNVTTAKIADSAVTTAKIADSNVTTAKIADSNVTTAKIADSNVTTDKIADLNVTTGKVAALAITDAKINDFAFSKGTGNLALGAGQNIGFFAATAAAQQAVSAFTNSISSGGSSNTVADYSIVDYATDSVTIKANAYQTARTLNLVVAALRLYGLLG